MHAVSARAGHVISGVSGLDSLGLGNLCGEVALKDCVLLIYAGRFNFVGRRSLGFVAV